MVCPPTRGVLGQSERAPSSSVVEGRKCQLETFSSEVDNGHISRGKEISFLNKRSIKMAFLNMETVFVEE